MLEVARVTSISDPVSDVVSTVHQGAVSVRRGGFVHGTKIATTAGWKPVERLRSGDLVRTRDHGFKEVRRISTDLVAIPAGETRPENLPVRVPSRAAYNGRPVWLMPEQGMAVEHGKLDPSTDGLSVLPARLLSGLCQLRARAPGERFEVSTLYFDQDEVIFIEGGLQAYCMATRFGLRPVDASQTTYDVVDDADAAGLVEAIEIGGNIAVLANPLGALPAPIPQETIFPVRPPKGIRRPGRPGRPPMPTLFLRPEWMMITHQK